MTLEDKVHGLRLQVIRQAEKLGNVSRPAAKQGSPAPCSIAGGSARSATAWTACIRGGSGRGRGAPCSCRPRPSGWSSASRSVPRRGGQPASPPTCSDGRSCEWRPARCSAPCAGPG